MRDVDFMITSVVLGDAEKEQGKVILRICTGRENLDDLMKYENEKIIRLIGEGRIVIADIVELWMDYDDPNPCFGFMGINNLSCPLEEMTEWQGRNVRITLEQD